MKPQTSQQIKKGLKEIADGVLPNSFDIFSFLINVFYLAVFFVVFAFGFIGLTEKLITGYFEITITIGLLLLCFAHIRINYGNGLLSIATLIFGLLGILGILIKDTNLLTTGYLVLKICYYVTLGAGAIKLIAYFRKW